jgi:Na+-transporting NADH:ubiquinone oxidoreductase subunit NqrB
MGTLALRSASRPPSIHWPWLTAIGARTSPARSSGSPRRLDPRLWQIASLAALLLYGRLRLGFEVSLAQIAITLIVALGTQWLGTKARRLATFDPRSALISALSLGLLLRASHPAVLAFAAVIAVGSKFVLRVRGKHIFNPTNLGVIAAIALTRHAWVSPGQWGNFAFFAFLMACVGGLVVNRAARSDVTFAFLVCHAGLLLARALWLGQRVAVPLHQMENGAFLLFAFFMISDPRTTPDSRAGRVLLGTLVAIGAASVTFLLYRSNGLLWSLVVLSPLTPLIDRLLPGPRHHWNPDSKPSGTHTQEVAHETPVGRAVARPEPHLGPARA